MKNLLKLTLIIFILSAIAQSQPKRFPSSIKRIFDHTVNKYSIEWQRYYDEMNVSSDEVPVSAYIDDQKNIYTTSNFRTVKIDSNGQLSWIRSWDAGYTFSQGRKIFSDNKGHIFITGDVQIGPAQHQVGVAIVKYDIDGTKLWDRWYTGLSSTATRGGYGVCDSDGNAILSGFVYKDLPDTVKYVLIKYSPDGEIIWKIEYPAYNGNGYALSVDFQNNVYLAGYLYDPLKKAKYGIVKFNSAGVRQWFAETPFAASDMIVDASGNIFITQVDWSNGPTVYAAKYSGNGLKLWQNKVGSFSSYVISPVVDASGSLYISSASVVTKFNSNGTLAWQKSAPRSIESSTTLLGKNGWLYFLGGTDLIRCDTEGNFQPLFTFSSTNQAVFRLDIHDQAIILGSIEPNSSRSVDIKVWKTSPDGELLWSSVYDLAKVQSANWVKQMIVDKNGNTLIAGGQDNLILSYDQNGDLTLKNRFRTAASYEDGTAICVAPDNTIILGSGCRFECSGSISKFKQNGELIWRKYLTENGDENFLPKFLFADTDGSIIVSGETYDNNSFYDIITMKYDANGSILWRKKYDGAQHRGDYVNDLKLDNKGNIFVIGATVMDPKFATDVAIIKYSPAGELLWNRNYEGEAREIDEGYSAVLDPSSNIYVGGVTNLFVLGTRSEFLLTKYSTNGDSLWSYKSKHGGKTVTNLSKITMLTDQSIVGTGIAYSFASAGFGLVRIDTSGKPIWAQIFDSSFSAKVYTSWHLASNTFDEIGVIALVYNDYNQHDLIFYALNKDGDIIDGFRMYSPPGVGFDPMGINSTASGDFILTGNLTYGYESAIYVMKIKRSGQTSVIEIKNSIPDFYTLFQNYPNPFNPTTTIRYGLPYASQVTLKIYNVLGQLVGDLVDSEKLAGWHESTWHANTSSGIYFCKFDAVSSSDPKKKFTQLNKMVLLK